MKDPKTFLRFIYTTMIIERFPLNFTMCEYDEKAYQLYRDMLHLHM